jgi:hypothetical protein
MRHHGKQRVRRLAEYPGLSTSRAHRHCQASHRWAADDPGGHGRARDAVLREAAAVDRSAATWDGVVKARLQPRGTEVVSLGRARATALGTCAPTATGRLGAAGSDVPGPSPPSQRLRSPSDSLPPAAPTPVPLALTDRDADACAGPRKATTRGPADVPGVGAGSPVRRETGRRRGEARASQGTGPSPADVPWSRSPPEPSPLRGPHNAAGDAGCPQGLQAPRPLERREVAGPPSPGPQGHRPPRRHAGVPARRQAGSRSWDMPRLFQRRGAGGVKALFSLTRSMTAQYSDARRSLPRGS